MEQLSGFPTEKMKKVAALTTTVVNGWVSNHIPIPSVLFHYTTAEGLLGILTSHSFWMTNIRYMNDLSELQYAKDLVGKVLDSKASEYASNALIREFLGRVRDTFSPFEGGNDVFATCFCENGNLLSQWRAYGGKGGGYAVGISFFHLLRFLSKPCFLRKVLYVPDEQERIIRDVIDKVCALLNEVNPDQDIKKANQDNTLPQFCLVLNRLLGEYMFCFKHPEFMQEQEWRLVHVWNCDPILNREADFKDLKFRSFSGNIIPFCDVSFENAITASRQDEYGFMFPIQELVIGPTLSAEFNRESITTLLTKLNPDHFPIIKKSGIPLRWL